MTFQDDEWPGTSGREVTVMRNIKLSSTDHGHIRYVPFS